MNFADEIKRLHELHQSGALTDAEFAQAKAKLLASNESAEQSWSGTDQTINQLNQFRRSRKDQWLGGICGGLGKLTGVESWIWRLLFVMFTFYFGSGLVAYILAWIFIPEEE
ncbi:PspC domain-containing protein [Undibacterium sp. RTI2.1]|uniref:PspC domain-containing protein n=1 Tax=unclassified Undibacterium TaxID=2630295 RepID=UPI002AB5338F|nr:MULTISPECIES: PspC domain-containing protein [unclassified Undibacterium]MDY7537943.1 PspC domain-containing protein [Undibacterium sp. 5I1]MEB0031801.1 PspC domain-containing protein [Undibacterium sp. RTI2.1]MEB0117274.1 PspC domain-containing protein [Undibacterium sp. RTI2.2]MEB0231033.1 PspC domain-containing protein [Undibacterium sp. 10I3]MEB0257568.1 PspC domain-containing protein [Undibacterium sp. 5I1]